MCNHYDITLFGWAGIKIPARRKKKLEEATFDSHLYPRRYAPIIFRDNGENIIEDMRWGVFAKIQGAAKYITNARNDRLLKSVTWKQSAKTRRCLIPGCAYYEPGTGPAGRRGEIRFWVRERPQFFFAGLWDENPDDPDPAKPRAFAMVTTEPNATAAQFHDRMPVVLSDEEAAAWLGDQPLPEERLLEFCRGLPAEALLYEMLPAQQKAAALPAEAAPQSTQGELF